MIDCNKNHFDVNISNYQTGLYTLDFVVDGQIVCVQSLIIQ